jgi:hypothetical protein
MLLFSRQKLWLFWALVLLGLIENKNKKRLDEEGNIPLTSAVVS